MSVPTHTRYVVTDGKLDHVINPNKNQTSILSNSELVVGYRTSNMDVGAKHGLFKHLLNPTAPVS